MYLWEVILEEYSLRNFISKGFFKANNFYDWFSV